jgi:hypothetical protein
MRGKLRLIWKGIRMKSTAERLDELEATQARHKMYAGAAVIVAAVFGVSGAWGLNLLQTAKASVADLGDKEVNLGKQIDSLSTSLGTTAEAALDKAAPDIIKAKLGALLSSQVPVGTVIAVCEAEADPVQVDPHYWQVCDGAPVKDESSPLWTDPKLYALTEGKVPDLRGRFVMGTLADEQPLGEGGSASLPDHKHAIDLETQGAQPTVDENKDRKTNGKADAYVVDTRDNEIKIAYHTHRLTGDSGSVEQHPECLPPYCKLTWIIRIK